MISHGSDNNRKRRVGDDIDSLDMKHSMGSYLVARGRESLNTESDTEINTDGESPIEACKYTTVVPGCGVANMTLRYRVNFALGGNLRDGMCVAHLTTLGGENYEKPKGRSDKAVDPTSSSKLFEGEFTLSTPCLRYEYIGLGPRRGKGNVMV